MNMTLDELFFSVLRAGLWGVADNVSDLSYENVDWKEVLMLAKEQTVLGFFTDGFSVMKDSGMSVNVTAKTAEWLMIQTIGIERANARLNALVAETCTSFKLNGIDYRLIKGQGTAQNYPHPEHRSPGDIDYLLDDKNYELASALLAPKAEKLCPEDSHKKHLGMFFNGDLEIELHGTARAGFGKKFDDVIDSMQAEMFLGKGSRSWSCQGAEVLLPSVNFDAVFIFTHFVQHFYHGGLGLRQICDWTMHLHSFASEIDRDWVFARLKALGMLNEWKAFGYLAVNKLGLPEGEMPLYDLSYAKHADRIWASIKYSGNFGRKMNEGRDYKSEPFLLRKTRSLRGHLVWMSRHFSLSPRNTIIALYVTLISGFSAAFKGD